MTSGNIPRRKFLGLTGLGVFGLTLTGNRSFGRPFSSAQNVRLYVGTYTSGRSEGIYICSFNPVTGEIKQVATVKGVANPSFLAIDRLRQHLYAVNEVEDFGGKPSGAVSAFRIAAKTGMLTFINQQPSMGGAPCYVIADNSRRFVLLANYSGGNVSVVPVRDGTLGTPVDVVQHHRDSTGAEPQQVPHAHSIVFDKANRYVFAADLGLDRIMIYQFDSRQGKLKANDQPWAQLKSGAGPRHFTFHPSERWAYVINELDSTITAFAYDKARGRLNEVQTIDTLPSGFRDRNSCADIHISPSGRFLYGSNRGHDSIAVFAIDPLTGKLTVVEHVPTGGKTPRNFAIDPSGGFLLAANQNSDNIVSFRIDPKRGTLQPTGHSIEIPTPVCLRF
jgi:6-phosphogluconolactonase